ncbi:hypothetical protein D1627_01445 [Pontibacter oryzae]|uniref:Uncharacterized protein n=1 Tax=Pontibacter oryzae TaxID=2304593 RepID=A0A399SK44_9BACT|nr:hypothetical protein D1627_01445 [Pontibacter oryzae]
MICSFSCATKAQNEKNALLCRNDIEKYSYDTLLSQCYHLSYSVYQDSITNDCFQSPKLVAGNRNIRQLSETSYPMLYKNLGYIGADFGKFFLFVQSFG